MERADGNDKTSQPVQARDKNGGGLKWTATIAVAVKSFDRDKYENLSITLNAPTQPCANIATGAPVMIDGLVQGLGNGAIASTVAIVHCDCSQQGGTYQRDVWKCWPGA